MSIRNASRRSSIGFAALGLLLLCLGGNAAAQATRTWVSGVGDDANPCSRTAPCKTYAGAISKTATGGEINAIDPGGFGAVTITKSITIDGGGTLASTLASGTNGVIVNAAVGSVITLRNLTINGAGGGAISGLAGIRFLAGAELRLENVQIFGFLNNGIEFAPSAASGGGRTKLYINNSQIHSVTGAAASGILVAPVAPSLTFATMQGVRIESAATGLQVKDGGNVVASDCVVSGSTASGVAVVSTSAATNLLLERCVISGNGIGNLSSAGVKSTGAQSFVRLASNAITTNQNGIRSVSGGRLVTFLNNRISGNLTDDGAPNETAPTE